MKINGCHGKKRYNSPTECHLKSERQGVELRSYYCHTCDGWHRTGMSLQLYYKMHS